MELNVDHKGTEIKLMTYRWEPEQDQEVKGVIFMVHGYGANAAQMAVVAKYMAQNGYDVFAVDMRGHGDSEGERGVFLSSDQLYSDLWAFIFESIKKFRINQQTTPLFLMGRSFGGLLITNMANTLVGKSMFKGVVLITPYYRLFTERLYEAYKYLVPLTYVRPNHLFLSEYAEMDPEYYKRYEQIFKDPRNVDGFTATTARIWVEEQEVARKSISETPLPICFLIATEDGVVRNDYIEEFSGLASHPQNECHKVHGADHTDLIFNEHYCSQMIRTIDNFLDKLLTTNNN